LIGAPSFNSEANSAASSLGRSPDFCKHFGGRIWSVDQVWISIDIARMGIFGRDMILIATLAAMCAAMLTGIASGQSFNQYYQTTTGPSNFILSNGSTVAQLVLDQASGQSLHCFWKFLWIELSKTSKRAIFALSRRLLTGRCLTFTLEFEV